MTAPTSSRQHNAPDRPDTPLHRLRIVDRRIAGLIEMLVVAGRRGEARAASNILVELRKVESEITRAELRVA